MCLPLPKVAPKAVLGKPETFTLVVFKVLVRKLSPVTDPQDKSVNHRMAKFLHDIQRKARPSGPNGMQHTQVGIEPPGFEDGSEQITKKDISNRQ